MTKPSHVTVEPGDPRHPQATALLCASHALMQELFPSESNHFLSIDELCTPGIAFFIARREDAILGTGALADKTDYGEVKSMFVAPTARGTGTGAAILEALEAEARTRTLPKLMLETGHSLHAAHRLYQRAGFAFRGPFGAYPDDPQSRFMEKTLA